MTVMTIIKKVYEIPCEDLIKWTEQIGKLTLNMYQFPLWNQLIIVLTTMPYFFWATLTFYRGMRRA